MNGNALESAQDTGMFFNGAANAEIYALSFQDTLPITSQLLGGLRVVVRKDQAVQY